MEAAANGNLWIGLSAPDKNKNTGTVTLKEGQDDRCDLRCGYVLSDHL